MDIIERILTKTVFVCAKCLCGDLKLLKLFLVISATILLSSLTDAFNVDIASALIQRGPSGTHFGFSVSLHKDRGVNWLLVGAPLAHTDQPGVERGGAVYRCNVDSTHSCQQIPFDRTGSGEILLKGKLERTDNKTQQWFGATVHSNGENGTIVACAPRYTYYSTSLKRRDPVGTCWVSRGSFTGFFEFSPCRTSMWGYHRQGSCQAGFSAGVSKDGNRLYIGAVGSWYWQGQVFSQELHANQTLHSSREAPAYDDDSYLGYSLTLGEFTGDRDYDVAVGMPKGENLTGKVVLYTSTLRNIFNITGDQMGAYFGYSLTTADVNGDGLDDVVIGAPLYSHPKAKDQSYEKGRIYIAYQTREHIFRIKEDDHIDGTRSKARFGMALASLGDINKDKYQDIAVGSPYDGERESGAVYIYLGSKNGLQPQFSQVIYAEYINDPGLKTFGFSLSAGLDMDNNQYPDLLVGAYASDRAILLKARPVVNVMASLTIEKESVSLDDRSCHLVDKSQAPCVSIKLCLQYNGTGVENRLDFIFETKLDAASKRAPRIFFLHKEGENEERISVELNKGRLFCSSRQAYLSSNLRDKLTPIKVSVEYSLNDIPGQNLLTPVLNQAIPNVLHREINIRKNCSNNVCIPNLILTVKPNIEEYIVGSRKKIELDISVLNRGEDAFESMLYLFMPIDVNYVNINKSKNSEVTCYGAKPDKTGINSLECDIGNPLPSGKKTAFTIIMEPSKTISATSPDYLFIIEVNSTNLENENNTKDNKDIIGIPLKVEANLAIYGSSDPSVLSFNASAETFASPQVLEDIGREISHTYTLLNRGPSTIKKADVTILWPTRDLKGKYLLYLVDQPNVKAKPGKAFCKSITLDDLNPMRLKSRKVVNRTTPEAQMSVTREQAIIKSYGPYHDSRTSRNERDVNTLYGRQRISTRTRANVTDVMIEQLKSCGDVKCTRIICTVYEIETNESVNFKISSRFWKEYIESVEEPDFQISSKLVAVVTQLPYDVDHRLIEPIVNRVHTQFYVIGIEKSAPIALWIYLVAILIALLILTLLSLALWKFRVFQTKATADSERRSRTVAV